MNARSRPTYHHGDLVNAIRATALRLVAARGGPQFTLRELAKEIGVVHGAVYTHFANKQALLDHLAVVGLGELYDAQQARLEQAGHPLAQLQGLAFAYVEFARSQPGAYRLIFNGEYSTEEPDSVHSARRSGASLMLQVIRSAQDQKLIQAADTQLLALSLWSVAHGFADLVISRHARELPAACQDLDASLSFAVRAALYGVATRVGRAWLNGQGVESSG